MKIEPPRASRLSLQESREPSTVSGQRWLLNETSGRVLAGSLRGFEIGQELQALVIEQLADGRVVLELGGTLVEANDPGGLSRGQNLRVQVDLIEPQLMLHIIEQDFSLESELTQLMRRHLPSGEQLSLATLLDSLDAGAPFHELGAPPQLEKLKSFLAELLHKNEALTVESLQQFVRDGGLHYEAKLAKAVAANSAMLGEIPDGDLKGLLLGAFHELNQATSSSELRGTIASQLSRIEGQQAANLLAQLEGHSFQLQIPFASPSGFGTVAVSVDPDEHGKSASGDKRKRGYSILFVFDLENFGRTRIDAHLRQADLAVTFYVEQPSALTLLHQEFAGLRQTLHDLGYQQVLLGARSWREVSVELERKFDALSLGVPADVNLVNLKV